MLPTFPACVNSSKIDPDMPLKRNIDLLMCHGRHCGALKNTRSVLLCG